MSYPQPFQERFKGKSMSVSKFGMEGVISQRGTPVDKLGWQKFLSSINEEEQLEQETKLKNELKELNQLERRILPKISRKIVISENSRSVKLLPKRSKEEMRNIRNAIENSHQVIMINKQYLNGGDSIKKERDYKFTSKLVMTPKLRPGVLQNDIPSSLRNSLNYPKFGSWLQLNKDVGIKTISRQPTTESLRTSKSTIFHHNGNRLLANNSEVEGPYKRIHSLQSRPASLTGSGKFGSILYNH